MYSTTQHFLLKMTSQHMHCVGLLSHQKALCKDCFTQQKLCVEKILHCGET